MKILYVLGRGRSGSTILANVLGELDGFFSAGEVRSLWDPIVVQRSRCGCGAAIGDCPVWSHVLDKLSDVDLEQVVAWQHAIVKESNIARLIRYRRGAAWRALEGYAAVTERMYSALADVTGCRVIVDSSKRPSYAAFVRTLRGCDPYYVHLARDPRASAYSWKTRRYASARGDDEVVRRNAIDSTVRWNMLNLGSESLLRAVGHERSLRLRYEDFVDQPRRHTRDIAALVGERVRMSQFVDEQTVLFRTNHTIAGNPSRFMTGAVRLRDGAEWKTEQRALDRWLATAVALPFLHRYGYAIRAH